MFLAVGDVEGALSCGAGLREDTDFVRRPMAEVLELEGARGYDGEA